MVFVIAFGSSFREWVIEFSNDTSNLNPLSSPYWPSTCIPHAVVTIIPLHVCVIGSIRLGRTCVVNICAVINDSVFDSVRHSSLDSIRPMS